ncbi:MAG TPA: CapA family protein, partial [Nitrospirota bacterium]|nr:CapA family protein [Nitrospirota bacterium]
MSMKTIVYTVLTISVLALSSRALPAQDQSPQIITITAVGDIMMGTTYPEDLLPPDDGNGIFRDAIPALSGSDIVLGNLEGPLVDGGETTKCENSGKTCFAFRTPTRYVQHLTDAGFTALHIANNHANDFGQEGMDSTLRVLTAAGIQAVGGKAVARFEAAGKRVAVAGFSYSASPYSYSLLDRDAAQRTIRELSRECDVLVVSFHGGAEGSSAQHVADRDEQFLGEERGNVVAFAHAAVDAGADLVIGHGPHVLRALELYQGKLIAYSLGNFLTYARFNIDGPNGLSLAFKVRIDAGTGDLLDAALIPFRLAGEGIPVPDQERKAIRLIKDLTRKDIASPGIVITDDGKVTVQKKRKKAGILDRGAVSDPGKTKERAQ